MAQFVQSMIFHETQVREIERIIDEIPSLGSIGRLAGDEVASPLGAITIASTATAGNLTGTFFYSVSYVTALGETAPWPGTPNSTGALASKQVSLSNIPVSPDAGVIARKLWRTDGTTTEPKDFQFLATIPDNTTTTYVDNNDSNSGVYPSWSSTNRGVLLDGSGTVATFSDQTTSLGNETFGNGKPGYASTAIGYRALYDNTSGRRNVAVGVYALENIQVGFENTAVGTHAGGGIGPGVIAANTMIGYAAGSTSNSMGNNNAALGAYAFSAAVTKGFNCTAVGAYALSNVTSGWSNLIGIGYYAGAYANAADQVFIDSRNRTNITNSQDIGLVYGEVAATAAAQRMRINAAVRLGGPNAAGSTASTVANLPAAAAALTGYRHYVTDANATTFNSVVAGGGANVVPVFCNGTAWVIG